MRVNSPTITPLTITLFLAAAASAVSAISLSYVAPLARSIEALFLPDLHDLRDVVVFYSWFPRLIISLLCGAGLGLSGAVFQRILRNSLADPTTLGVSAGAQLALTLARLFAPWLLVLGTETVAIAGAALTAVLIAALAWRHMLSPTGLVLGGLMVSLCAGALGNVLALLFGEDLGGIFVWSTGMLNQNDWSGVADLLPRICVATVMLAFLLRPITLMALNDDSARSLGLPLRAIRLLAMAPAIAISAFVVSEVGVVGFIGLAAPTLARLAGARRLKQQLIWAPLIGAGLLWLTDQLVQLAAHVGWLVPTGTATAMLGAPLMLWLLPRMTSELSAVPEQQVRSSNPMLLLLSGVMILVFLLWPALDLAYSFDGLSLNNWSELQPLLHLRAPRVFAAMSAGAMLALAGALMQRFTGNAMASPEVLGISSGASLAAILALLAIRSAGDSVLSIAASCGALATLLIMLAIGHRSHFSPQRMVLTGIALGTSVSAITSFLMASHDPRLASALSWLSGSTYRLSENQAILTIATTGIGLLLLPLLSRWLEILPLGEATARAVGVNIRDSRMIILVLAAVLTGVSTLVVGPLSFVGLMAPHMARMLGINRALLHLFGAAVLGALIMMAADWLGRNLLFPSQIPAGLLATFIGAPYFFFSMRKQP